ncbi:MAG: hypothetical protein ABJN03_01795 [Ascidiaceihabitans sp.]|uniref:hypothetical protein n=1 Tax=Rhodobacterales TaxID=204455 RepID=UPI0032994FF0
MHNAPQPNIEDLPTKAQLRRSSIIAGIGSVPYSSGSVSICPQNTGRTRRA